MGRDLVKLTKDLEAASREARRDHPAAYVLQAFSLSPDALAEDVRRSTAQHLGGCERCRTAVSDTRSRSGFFSRQQTMLGDCDDR